VGGAGWGAYGEGVALHADAVRRALAEHVPTEAPALPGRTNHLRAGILVPLRLGGDPSTVLTERPRHLSAHGGEVCFPGGRPEAADVDLEATALREAREELAIEQARVLGRLSSIPLYTSDYRLEPFVAEVRDTVLRPHPGEVERVLEVPLAALLDVPFLHAAPWEQDGTTVLAPLFEVDGALVYGGTAYVLYELLIVVAPLMDRPVPPLRPGKHTWASILG
jgi:8-oxo-dGTP pyrophosphatase MutT (NUDIX family)